MDRWLHVVIIIVHNKGIAVNYAGEVAGIPPGPATIRCIILLWTGDYPAQSEVGKFICNGIRPCRRCKLVGMFRCKNNTNYLMFREPRDRSGINFVTIYH